MLEGGVEEGDTTFVLAIGGLTWFYGLLWFWALKFYQRLEVFGQWQRIQLVLLFLGVLSSLAAILLGLDM